MKYLYIISQDDKNRFKIGITNNFNRRKKELTRDWGEFHTSFLLRDNINEVDTLEKILNEEFKGYSREFKFKNQGYSEFFDLCILNDVIEYVSSISTDDLVFNKKK